MEWVFEPLDIKYAEDLKEAADDKTIFDHVRDYFPHPYTQKDAQWFIDDCLRYDSSTRYVRAIVADSHLAGLVDIKKMEDVARKTAELGYWIRSDLRGRGIVPMAVDIACREAFDTMDIERIEAEVFDWNQASRRVMEKCGFVLEAILKKRIYKNGRLGDACIYAKWKNPL